MEADMPSYLANIGALGLGGPGDDAGNGEACLAGVDKVGRVHLPGQSLDVAQDGHLHLQVGGLRLIHDEAHQDVELLLVWEGLPAWRREGGEKNMVRTRDEVTPSFLLTTAALASVSSHNILYIIFPHILK